MKVPIQDCLFLFTGARGAGGFDCVPAHFDWEARASDSPARFYTDFCMRNAVNYPRPRIGWLIEAPPYAQCHYDWAVENEDKFDYILTYVKSYVERGEKWLYYPRGGSHIALPEWGLRKKSRLVSFLASNKYDATGHKLRFKIYSRFECKVDVWGSIMGQYLDDKAEALGPYQYSIVVAAECNDWCFCDHLIDCLAVGTVPIYWGCPEIEKFFNPDGIISFESVGELPAILSGLSIEDYEKRLPAVRKNLEIARQYRVPEDWIHRRYPFLFKGLQ